MKAPTPDENCPSGTARPAATGDAPSSGGDVERRVLDVLQDVLALEGPPARSARLRGNLLASSMDAMTLMLALEDEFGASLPEDLMAGIESVADLIAAIEDRV